MSPVLVGAVSEKVNASDASAIEFNLGFTGTARPHTNTTGGLATGLSAHGLTPTAQSRQKVLKLSQFNLRLTFTALCVLGKNVKNHRGAVNNFDFDNIL